VVHWRLETQLQNAISVLIGICLSAEFFRKQDVATMTVKQLFDFITDPLVTEENMSEYLDKVSEVAVKRHEEGMSAEQEVTEEVFKNVYIPRTLDEVSRSSSF